MSPSGRRFVLVTFLMVVGLFWAGSVPAETRSFRDIRTHQSSGTYGSAGEVYVPVERGLVRRAVRRIVEAWNRRRLEAVLAPGFYDRERLLRLLELRVPQDARLRLIALRDMMVLDQTLGMPHPGGYVPVVSEVLVEVRTQVTWNDPNTGFQSRDGVNVFRLTLRYRLQP